MCTFYKLERYIGKWLSKESCDVAGVAQEASSDGFFNLATNNGYFPQASPVPESVVCSNQRKYYVDADSAAKTSTIISEGKHPFLI